LPVDFDDGDTGVEPGQKFGVAIDIDWPRVKTVPEQKLLRLVAQMAALASV